MGIRDIYYDHLRPGIFDIAEHLQAIGLSFRDLQTDEGRRITTRLDPLLFTWVYMPNAITNPDTGDITLTQFHIDMFRWARTTLVRRNRGQRELRDCWIAPRRAGKSTLAFKVLPMWALMSGHQSFVAAYANTFSQATNHLQTFRRELDTNELLRHDRPRRTATFKGTQDEWISKADNCIFFAKGVDSSTLGLKVGDTRPSLILLDDVEPDASNYSSTLKDKRLDTIINSIMYQELSAVVAFVGTVTMHGSIIHDIKRHVSEPGAPDLPEWVSDQNIKPRYYPALIVQEDGTKRSFWPEIFSTESLLEVEHTPDFQLQMMNDPRGVKGNFWTSSDIKYGEIDDAHNWTMQIDPAVTTKGTSDYTGIAVVRGLSRGQRQMLPLRAARVEIVHSEGVKLTGEALRTHILRLLDRFPEIKALRIETNQGGDLWGQVFHHMPPDLKIVTHHSVSSKEERFLSALTRYQLGQVVHRGKFNELEAQMTGYPRVQHDDVLDAAMLALLFYLPTPMLGGRKVPVSVSIESYL